MDSTALVQGTVLDVSTRSGITRRDPANPREYSIKTARVLVAGNGLADVTIPDDYPEYISEGSEVAMIVSVGTYAGQPAIRAVKPLRLDHLAELLAAAGSK
jgi:hypothetical protein